MIVRGEEIEKKCSWMLGLFLCFYHISNRHEYKMLLTSFFRTPISRATLCAKFSSRVEMNKSVKRKNFLMAAGLLIAISGIYYSAISKMTQTVGMYNRSLFSYFNKIFRMNLIN